MIFGRSALMWEWYVGLDGKRVRGLHVTDRRSLLLFIIMPIFKMPPFIISIRKIIVVPVPARNGLKLEKETTHGIVRWTRVHPRT